MWRVNALVLCGGGFAAAVPAWVASRSVRVHSSRLKGLRDRFATACGRP
jgi:hypothetical protein